MEHFVARLAALLLQRFFFLGGGVSALPANNPKALQNVELPSVAAGRQAGKAASCKHDEACQRHPMTVRPG